MKRFGIDEARAYIAQVRWQFAKMMPQWPHEYTVRQWYLEREADFEAFVLLIREIGIVKPWPPDKPFYHHTYLAIEGWEYWTMGASLSKTVVINRARIE